MIDDVMDDKVHHQSHRDDGGEQDRHGSSNDDGKEDPSSVLAGRMRASANPIILVKSWSVSSEQEQTHQRTSAKVTASDDSRGDNNTSSNNANVDESIEVDGASVTVFDDDSDRNSAHGIASGLSVSTPLAVSSERDAGNDDPVSMGEASTSATSTNSSNSSPRKPGKKKHRLWRRSPSKEGADGSTATAIATTTATTTTTSLGARDHHDQSTLQLPTNPTQSTSSPTARSCKATTKGTPEGNHPQPSRRQSLAARLQRSLSSPSHASSPASANTSGSSIHANLKRTGEEGVYQGPPTVKLVDVGRYDFLGRQGNLPSVQARDLYDKALAERRWKHRPQSTKELAMVAASFTLALIIAFSQPILHAYNETLSAEAVNTYTLVLFVLASANIALSVTASISLDINAFYGNLLLLVITALFSSFQLFELFSDMYTPSVVQTVTSLQLLLVVVVVVVCAMLIAPVYEEFGELLFDFLPAPAAHELFHGFSSVALMAVIMTLLNLLTVGCHYAFYLPEADIETSVLLPLAAVDCAIAYFVISVRSRSLRWLHAYAVWLIFISAGYLYKVIRFHAGYCSFCDLDVLPLSLAASVNLVMSMLALGVSVRAHRVISDNASEQVPKRNPYLEIDSATANVRINPELDMNMNRASDFRFKRVSSYRLRTSSVRIHD